MTVDDEEGREEGEAVDFLLVRPMLCRKEERRRVRGSAGRFLVGLGIDSSPVSSLLGALGLKFADMWVLSGSKRD